MNKIKFRVLIIGLISFFLFQCEGTSFNDQIIGDVTSKMATGICDSIPRGSTITNVLVGEIVDIGLQGMTDVSIEFDYETNGNKKHHSSALLYIKKGSSYKLAAIGGCEFEMK